MKQKPTQHKLGGFMEGKGYYIVLFLCIAAIGISGYFLFRGLFAQPEGFGSEQTAVVSGQAEMTQDQDNQQAVPPAASEEDAAAAADPQEDTAAQEAPAAQEDTASPDEEAAASSAYVWPVEGSVDRDFSLEVFAYDATMGD